MRITKPTKRRRSDEHYMKLALKLAGKGNPSPNPYVGCVIVKNNEIIGQGYHSKVGEAHAEAAAIANVSGSITEKKKKISGSTFYVTLEPCVHYGRTPPCVDKVISFKPKKVVIAMQDPNPLVNGRGIKKLMKAGIEVKPEVLEQEALYQNRVYNKYMLTGIPYVLMKSAVTMNWKISWGDGKKKRITGKDSHEFVHELRNQVDSILVGINTVIRDDPHLTTRITKNAKNLIVKNPLRVILDSKLKIPLNANVLNDSNVIIITGSKNKVPSVKKKLLRQKGINVFVTRDKRISIKEVLKILGNMGKTSLLIEGGARINTSAIKSKIADEIFFLVAPFVINDKDPLNVFSGSDDLRFKKMSVQKLGDDFVIKALPAW
jgi:diaminohydroxyphosphoribosylaminopyrimidine deaminase / 5-amino-6-(5-phosphoribosylamino)uracil reductase